MEIEQLKIGHKDWQTILVCQMHDAHKPLNGKTYRHARTTINLRRNSKQLQQHWKWIYHPTQRLQLEPTTKLQLEVQNTNLITQTNPAAQNSSNKPPCAFCGKVGHGENYCWIKFPDKKPQNSNSTFGEGISSASDPRKSATNQLCSKSTIPTKTPILSTKTTTKLWRSRKPTTKQ